MDSSAALLFSAVPFSAEHTESRYFVVQITENAECLIQCIPHSI